MSACNLQSGDMCRFAASKHMSLPCRDLSPKAAYVHVCGNETMSGLAFHQEPSVGPGHTLVTDMTSSLLSRPVDVSKYGVIYASSGKNLGPAGVAVVIVREDLLGHEAAQVSCGCN